MKLAMLLLSALVGSAPASDAATGAAPTAPITGATRRVGEEPLLEVVPRQLVIGVGWAYCALDRLPDARSTTSPRPHGIALASRYLWQVGGLGRRWPSWIGFHVGLDVFPATSASRPIVGLGYGLYVKHGLGRHPRARPFVAYGLGAVQAFVSEVDGRGIGHQTHLAAGVDVPLGGPVSLSLELAYKFQSLPTFRFAPGDVARWDFHVLTLLAGTTFDFAPRIKPPPASPRGRAASRTATRRGGGPDRDGSTRCRRCR